MSKHFDFFCAFPGRGAWLLALLMVLGAASAHAQVPQSAAPAAGAVAAPAPASAPPPPTSPGEITAATPAAEVPPSDVMQLRMVGEAVQLNVGLRFELPALLEDALHKGIPVYFVQEARIVSERWYWSNKVVAHVERHLRLSFQPLTRRWRLHTSASALTERGLGGVSLGASFDSLEDAMSAMQRITRWSVAEQAQLPSSGNLLLEVQMRVDTGQLPRPLQIGTLGRSSSSVLATRSKHIDVQELQ